MLKNKKVDLNKYNIQLSNFYDKLSNYKKMMKKNNCRLKRFIMCHENLLLEHSKNNQTGTEKSNEKTDSLEKDENDLKKCSICFKTEKILLCSLCKKISYCSKECQKIDWPKHKLCCLGKIQKLIKSDNNKESEKNLESNAKELEQKMIENPHYIYWISRDKQKITAMSNVTIIARKTPLTNDEFKWQWGNTLNGFSKNYKDIEKYFHQINKHFPGITKNTISATNELLDVLLAVIFDIAKFDYIQELIMGPENELYICGFYNTKIINIPNIMNLEQSLALKKILKEKPKDPGQYLDNVIVKKI